MFIEMKNKFVYHLFARYLWNKQHNINFLFVSLPHNTRNMIGNQNKDILKEK